MIVETTSYKCDRCGDEVATSKDEMRAANESAIERLQPAGTSVLGPTPVDVTRAWLVSLLRNAGHSNLVLCCTCVGPLADFMAMGRLSQ